MIFKSSLLTVDVTVVGSVLDPGVALTPVVLIGLLVVTIVDIVEEDDIGFELVLPADRVPFVKINFSWFFNFFQGTIFLYFLGLLETHKKLTTKYKFLHSLPPLGRVGNFSNSTRTVPKGRDAICSISTNNRWRRRYRSYFCLIFHRIAATNSRARKHLELQKNMDTCYVQQIEFFPKISLIYLYSYFLYLRRKCDEELQKIKFGMLRKWNNYF